VCHTGARSTGTIDLLAGGPDFVYPRENADLYKSIREYGLVLSGQQPGVEPTARHFPRRNRVTSRLSLGIVVVEVAARSRSLITARLAGEQGQEVLAIPGSTLDPRAKEPNKLIRDSAILLKSTKDVWEILTALRWNAIGEGRKSAYHTTHASAFGQNNIDPSARHDHRILGVNAVAD
jgi:DNA processing protein